MARSPDLQSGHGKVFSTITECINFQHRLASLIISAHWMFKLTKAFPGLLSAI